MLWIRDINSTNGTFLNGKRIFESETLQIGDVLHIGKIAISVSSMSECRPPENYNETARLDTSKLQLDQLDSYAAMFKKMIRNRSVEPHFQPILKLSDKKIEGYEILGRLPGETQLPSNPIDLFNIAALLNMEAELSSIFREVGLNQARQLPGSASFFVNTHPIELNKLSELQDSLRKLREIAVNTKIVLEINEKAITDQGQMECLLADLKSLDIGLAYDDFGVGESRLAELAKFPPDFLKFDISLIRGIHLAPKRLYQLIATFLKMSQDLGATTIAEGIECAEEEETCQQLGFDYAQGHYYSEPIPIHKFDLHDQFQSFN